MLRSLAIALAFLSIAACKKDAKQDKPAAVAPVTAGSTDPSGVRTVPINVDDKGYTPDRIAGKPGEQLKLVFTRTLESSCISQLKAPDGKLVDLPMNKPVEVAVTVPETGEAGFSCGMDMFHGAVVAQSPK